MVVVPERFSERKNDRAFFNKHIINMLEAVVIKIVITSINGLLIRKYDQRKL